MRVAVESTTLATVEYDEARERLQLEFRSRAVYLYFSVPPTVYPALTWICCLDGPDISSGIGHCKDKPIPAQGQPRIPGKTTTTMEMV